jgi:hypothetical protein
MNWSKNQRLVVDSILYMFRRRGRDFERLGPNTPRFDATGAR